MSANPVYIRRINPEHAAALVSEQVYERKVQFTLSRTQDSYDRFGPAVHEALRELMSKVEADHLDPRPGRDFIASNGVRVQVDYLDHEGGAMTEKSDPIVAGMTDDDVAAYIGFPSQEFTEEDYALAEAELDEIANAKPNPRKTA